MAAVFSFDDDPLELVGVPADKITVGSTPAHDATVIALSNGHPPWLVFFADKRQTRYLISKLQARLEDMV
jgi:hypothetical protein